MFAGFIPAVSLSKFQYKLAFLNLAFFHRSVFFLSKLYLALRIAVLYSDLARVMLIRESSFLFSLYLLSIW